MSFIEKLDHMLQFASPALIGWSADGTSFYVTDPTRLSAEVLVHYLRSSNFSSFVRQLNYYGFRKLTKPASSAVTSSVVKDSHYEFRHDLFLRGRPELRKDIRRRAGIDGNAAVQRAQAETSSVREQNDVLRARVMELEAQVATLNAKDAELQLMSRARVMELEAQVATLNAKNAELQLKAMSMNDVKIEGTRKRARIDDVKPEAGAKAETVSGASTPVYDSVFNQPWNSPLVADPVELLSPLPPPNTTAFHHAPSGLSIESFDMTADWEALDSTLGSPSAVARWFDNPDENPVLSTRNTDINTLNVNMTPSSSPPPAAAVMAPPPPISIPVPPTTKKLEKSCDAGAACAGAGTCGDTALGGASDAKAMAAVTTTVAVQAFVTRFAAAVAQMLVARQRPLTVPDPAALVDVIAQPTFQAELRSTLQIANPPAVFAS